MTPEEKLEKVEELLAARDEITAELLELMGAKTEEEEEEPEPVLVKKAGKVPKASTSNGCVECGSKRRHKATCSKVKTGKSSQEKIDPPVGDRRYKKHDEVMSEFNENMGELTPTDTALPKRRTLHSAPLRLTEEQYHEVMEQLGDGLTTSMINFSYPDIELVEINKAATSENYEDYLKKD